LHKTINKTNTITKKLIIKVIIKINLTTNSKEYYKISVMNKPKISKNF